MTKTKSLSLTAGIVLATAFTFCGCKEEAKEKKETPSAEATTEATAETASPEAKAETPSAEAIPKAEACKPSFDCKKASSKVEKMICDSNALACLDTKMSEVYSKARKGSKGEELLKTQRIFVKDRDKCNDASCVENMYKARIDLLEKDAAVVEVQFNKLQEKDGVYYLNNVPFTGVANRFDYGETIWTMKDGILHGRYDASNDGCRTAGDYKNGKKHGKWEDGCGDEVDIEIYEDGELISRNGELVKTGD